MFVVFAGVVVVVSLRRLVVLLPWRDNVPLCGCFVVLHVLCVCVFLVLFV